MSLFLATASEDRIFISDDDPLDSLSDTVQVSGPHISDVGASLSSSPSAGSSAFAEMQEEQRKAVLAALSMLGGTLVLLLLFLVLTYIAWRYYYPTIAQLLHKEARHQSRLERDLAAKSEQSKDDPVQTPREPPSAGRSGPSVGKSASTMNIAKRNVVNKNDKNDKTGKPTAHVLPSTQSPYSPKIEAVFDQLAEPQPTQRYL